MADEPIETPQETPIPLVDHEGKFSENFVESLPEEIRGEKVLSNLGDFPNMMKQFVHAQKQIGMDKVVIPNEKSTENDWSEFYRKIGRPDTAGDYGLAMPEDFPKEYDSEDLRDAAQELFHKIGLTKAQANALHDFNNANVLSSLQTQAEQMKIDKDNAERQLREELGVAYDDRLHFANRLIDDYTDEGEQRERFLKKFGNDPDFARFAGRVGSRLVEHKLIKGEREGAMTKKEALQKAEELRATDGFLTGKLATTNPAKFKWIESEIQRLYDLAYK